MHRRLGVAGAVVDGEVIAGDVVIDADAGIIVAIGVGGGHGCGLAVPGFVDIQVNGFAGANFAGCDRVGYEAASMAMAATGVTSFLATLPSPAPAAILAALDLAAAVVATPLGGAHCVGVHLEGPFLAPTRKGAHVEANLRVPNISLADTWLARGPVVLMTLAPELPGALDLIAHLRARDVAVALGHTDVDAAGAHAAYDAGAQAHTHVWNAHRPITSRDPGPGAVALTRSDAAPCMIADLVHVAAESLLVSVGAAHDRYVIVTDAVAFAGLAPGTELASHPGVSVRDGAVRLPDGTIAGSAGTLDASVRTLVGLGRPLPEVVAAVTSRPAALIGRTDLGRITVGGRADVVVLTDDLHVNATYLGGRRVA